MEKLLRSEWNEKVGVYCGWREELASSPVLRGRRAHLINKFGETGPTKDGEHLQENRDDFLGAEQRGEVGEEVVGVADGDGSDLDELVSRLEQDLAHLAVD